MSQLEKKLDVVEEKVKAKKPEEDRDSEDDDGDEDEQDLFDWRKKSQK